MTELTGQVLGGRYRVEAFLGQGGMADVYKVRDLQRATFLAMKVLHSDLAEDQVFIRNFEREAQTLERLQHPNIVRFYGFERAHDIAFILMDFIDGLTLRREIFLYKNGLRPGRILEIMQPVCAALYYAHQLGMIHCDIKPANIITHRNGMVYLTDFGIAHRSESATQPLTGVGSPAYMAPEQFEDKEPTYATDIYSLGLVLYEMLTGGQRPFTGDTGRETGSTTKRIIWEKKNATPPSPRVYNPEITPEMEAVVMVCLQRSPRRRFRSTLDLLQALEIAAIGLQPDDDVQTRVDLPAPGSGARESAPPARSGKAGAANREQRVDPAPGEKQTSQTNQPPDTPHSPADKPTPPARKLLPEEKPRPAVKNEPRGATPLPLPPDQDKASPAAKKAAETGDKPVPEGILGGPAGKPAPPPAQLSAASATPAAKKTTTEAAKPSTPAVKTLPASGKKRAEAGKPHGKVPAWWNRIPRWLKISAAGLALALAGLAIYSSTAETPGTAQTPTTPVVVAAASSTRTLIPSAPPPTRTSLPSKTAGLRTDTPAAALPAAIETPLPQPTPIGGSERIAFASDRSGIVQVWMMNASDPENRKQVTNAREGACQPSWSPDGEQIAYTTPCKGPSVYFAGSTIKIVRLADSTVTDLPVKAPGIGGAFDPAWSPDGKTLLYTAVLGEKTEIRAIDLQDLQMRTLANRGTKNAQPAWSRDGKFISYIHNDDQNWEALWYMQTDGDSKELLSRSGPFIEPFWAPDSLHILASVIQGNSLILQMIDRANPTAGAVRVLPDAYRISHASFSPDGQWLVYWTETGGGKPEIMLASLDGKEIRALTNNDLRDFHPSWSPK